MFSIICITKHSENPEGGVQILFSQRRIRCEIPFPITKYLEIPVPFFENVFHISSGILKNLIPSPERHENPNSQQQKRANPSSLFTPSGPSILKPYSMFTKEFHDHALRA